MVPLIPIALGIGTALAYRKVRNKKGMTPERKKTFETALKTLTDPDKLETLAAAFEKDGLKAEGAELRKRAKLRRLPKEQQQARRQAYKKGMSSSDPEKVRTLAQAFHKEGAYGAAQQLRNYAKGLLNNIPMVKKVAIPVQPKATGLIQDGPPLKAQ